MIITVSGLWKSHGARDLFTGADLQVRARDRVALVGPNGSGKTTLVEILMGLQGADRGDVSIASDVILGYLPQETDDLRGRSLLEEVLSVGAQVTDAGHRMKVLEHEMAEAPPGDERDRLVREYGAMQDRFATLGGYSLEAEAKKILGGLAFTEADHARRTETFSGGWLMRIALAKLLLSKPDLLMLDEPTNHLDVESVEWLERFLVGYEGALLLISHDRDFMNAIANKVVEIDRGKLVSYTGDYASFVHQRAEMMLQREAAAKHQARERAATETFINRFRYKASKARQVQSRIKALERVERIEPLTRSRRNMNLRFPTPPPASRVVVELADVTFGYDDKPVYNGLDLVVEKNHKIALVGPNGAGKSTLLKLLAGVLEPTSGVRRVGPKTKLGYFAQHQIEALDPSKRVIEELQASIPHGIEVKPRDLLGRFLFSGDDVDKPIHVLSGGERTRVALAKMLVSPLNLLCLDEPTNHLDIASRDVLEDALEDYVGALVLITHDRHLIRSVADRIVEVVDGKVTEYEGDYDYYLDKRERDIEEPRATSGPVRASAGSAAKERRRQNAQARQRTHALRKEISAIEKKLERAAAEMGSIGEILADPNVYSTDADIGDLSRRYESWQRRVASLEAAWEEATEKLEGVEAAEKAG
ncbi:MAG TPA: ABC-F family ATP-binding cassette domain-containing protein [Actinomycetota bacterium]|nr:ABC-F family ATP-binding cassette domain-containing protein [Actinomycetota bacterium]